MESHPPPGIIIARLDLRLRTAAQNPMKGPKREWQEHAVLAAVTLRTFSRRVRQQ